jgi:hypothetical protein
MPETIRLVNYFYVQASNKPGEGARLLTLLRDAGVNLLAVHAFPQGRRAQVDFVPSNAAAFKAAMRRAGLRVTGPKQAFIISGNDRPGALVGAFSKLAQAKINVTATSGVAAGAGRFGVILWVKPRDVKRGAKVLGAR